MYRLLVVDDEPTICKGILQFINWEELGFSEKECCYDGQTALELAIQTKFDLVLSDIRLPGMNGLQLIQRLRQSQCVDKFIILSAYADFSYAKQALQFGVLDYLLKPINPQELENAVRKFSSILAENKGITPLQKSYQESIYRIGELKYIMKSTNVQDVQKWFQEHFFNIITSSEGAFQNEDFLNFIYEKICSLISPLVLMPSEPPPQPDKLYEVLENACRQTVQMHITAPSSSGRLSPVEEVIAYVEKHYSEDLSLTQIAKSCYMNPAYLGRLFTASMNESFTNYLNNYRIDQSMILLMDDKTMVYEVCEKVGYKDLNYFYRVFKKRTGVTPTEYRKHHKLMNTSSLLP